MEVLGVLSQVATGSVAEREVLGQWSGWGALPQVFEDSPTEPWARATQEEMGRLMTPVEIDAAMRSTLNAHYTTRQIAAAMWRLADSLGFEGGRVLEPGCGPGVFMDQAPAHARMLGIERDPITAEVARRLHPQAEIVQAALEDYRHGGEPFALVIGNVPFASTKPFDTQFNKSNRLALHNYVLTKSLALSAPNALTIAITSSFTLDARSEAQRALIGEWGTFVGAVRLPDRAFLAQSGTQVTTDIVAFRRRPERLLDPVDQGLEISRGEVPDWMSVRGIRELGGQIGMNKWFHDNPELVLGELAEGGMYRKDQLRVQLDPDADLDAMLSHAFDRLAALDAPNREHRQAVLVEPVIDLTQPVLPVTVTEPDPKRRRLTPEDLPVWAKQGSIFTDPLMPRGFAQLVGDEVVSYVPSSKKDEPTLRALLGLRNTMLDLITAELNDEPVGDIERLRTRLGSDYETAVRRIGGPLNQYKLTVSTPKNGKEPTVYRRYPRLGGFRRDDPDYSALLALESYDSDTQTAARRAIFATRQIKPVLRPTTASSLSEAVAMSMGETGELDLDRITELLADTTIDIEAGLSEVAFQDPSDEGRWLFGPHYLSGNVRQKLDAARSAAVSDPAFKSNVAALEAVLPPTLVPEEISVRLGVSWLTPTDITDFINDTLGATSGVEVFWHEHSGWALEAPSWQRSSVAMTQTWGTNRKDALTIITAGLMGKVIKVQDKDANDRTYLNKDETLAANEKLVELNDALADWCWHKDPVRADRLAARYNKAFRSYVPPQHGGEWLNPVGLVDGFELRPHQRQAVARVIVDGGALLAHAVGAGKTAEMATAGMEMRRMGLINKPLYVVPNVVVEQFGAELRYLFPNAAVLVPDQAQKTPKRRAELVGRIAAGDWDAIVISHTTFKSIPVNTQTELDYLDGVVAATREAQSAASASGAQKTIKKIAKALETAEANVKKLRDNPRNDSLTFEQLGVDYIFVDEAHEFKNLAVPCANPELGFGGTRESSKKATDLDLKIQLLRRTYPERRGVVTFATGTPVPNRVAELYVMQHYLQPEALRAAGIGTFDSWAAQFGKTVTGYEMAVDNTWKLKTRFARYQNLPELQQILGTVADIQMAEDLNLPRPKLAGGKPQIVVLPASDELAVFSQELEQRADAAGGFGKEDNMLAIMSEGRLAALDLRLVGRHQPHPSKVDTAAQRILEIWDKGRNQIYNDVATGEPHHRTGGLQIVFCDHGVEGTNSKSGVNLYRLLRDELVEAGMPGEQVEFIQNHKTPAKKSELFNRCRDGRVSVLIGSTTSMSTGMNVQARATALHHLDPTWRPADIEQREGRVWRQGNQNAGIEILRYATEKSFDVLMWQTLERKAGFIAQVMKAQPGGGREIEEVFDENELSFAEVKSLATGDPKIIDRMQLDRRHTDLARLESTWSKQRIRLEASLPMWRNRRVALATKVDGLLDVAGHLGEQMDLTIVGQRFDTIKEADVEIRRLTRRMRSSDGSAVLGSLGGLPVEVRRHIDAVDFTVGAHTAKLVTTLSIEDLVNEAQIGSRLLRLARSAPSRASDAETEITRLGKEIRAGVTQVEKPFTKAAELAEVGLELATLTAEIEAEQTAPQLPTTDPNTIDGSVKQEPAGRNL